MQRSPCTRAGLICTVTERAGMDDVTLTLSGPFALFRKTRLYGRALGEIIPMLAWCARFRLHADCVLQERRLTLQLRTGDPIFPGSAPRRHDSRLEERFAREFRKLAPGWDVLRDKRPPTRSLTALFPSSTIRSQRPGPRTSGRQQMPWFGTLS
jgi:predicted nuclease of restriction endonuclease-like RecB superfamily